jgi:hypothetical protein
MGYTYTIIDLESIDETGANIRPVKSYIPVTPPRTSISIGEKLRLTLQVTTAPKKFKSDQLFCLNLRLFSSPNDLPSFVPAGFGWLIKLTADASGLVASWNIVGNEANRNFTINSVTITGIERFLNIEMDFFVTADLHDWAVKEFINNNKRLLRNSFRSPFDLFNTQASCFNRVDSYIEIAVFECNSSLQPFSVITPFPNDPIVRNSAATQFETFAINVSTKWYDENEGASNDWISTTDKKENFLQSININAGLLLDTTDIAHRGYPFYYRDTMRNLLFNSGNTQMVVNVAGASVANKNNVNIVIDTPNLPDFSTLIMYLIRIDKENDAVDFTDSYLLDAATIPKLFPGAGTINGGAFETPSAFSVAGGLTTIDFILNGRFLDAGGEYHLIALLYDSATDFSSAHISPPLSASLAQINPLPTITGVISTYKQDHTNVNDLSVTNFERVKLRIEVDGNTYGLTAFQNELRQVRLKSTLLGQNTTQSTTNFQAFLATGNTSGVGNPEIDIIDLGGGIWAFEVTLRSYYAATVILQSFHTWELVFELTGFNQPEEVVLKFEQRLKHRPVDTTRLPAMRILDHPSFPTLVEKKFICTSDERVIIETTKNGAPDANQIAILLTQNPANSLNSSVNNQDVIEEEAYVGNLPLLTSVIIEAVDPLFSSQLDPDKAYWTLVVDGFSQAGDWYVETLIYDV